jgi:hypothetical protein
MAQTNVQAFSGDVEISSNLAVDTNTLFVDSVGGTVGIGSTLIDITDNTLSGAGNGLYIHNPVEGGHLLTLGTQRPWVFEQGLANASAKLCLRSLNNGKRFSIQSPDHSNVMTIVATNGGGAVGIGTTNPLELLDIANTGNDNFIRIQAGGATSNYGGIQFTENGTRYGWRQFYDALTDRLFFSTQNNDNEIASNVMVMKTNGNVGIGTTNPTARLELYSSTLNKTHIRVNADDPTVTEDRIFELTDVSGSGLLQMGDRFNNNGSTYKIQLNTEGNSFFNGGNVGIGADSPTSKLEILTNDDTGFSNVIALSIQAESSDHTSIANGFGSRIQFRTNRGTNAAGSSASADIKGYVWSGAGSSGDFHALDLDVYGDNSALNPGISIKATSAAAGTPAYTLIHGNVGIGADNPTSSLHINGSTMQIYQTKEWNYEWTGNNVRRFTIPVTGQTARGSYTVECEANGVAQNGSGNKKATFKGHITNYGPATFVAVVEESLNVDAFYVRHIGSGNNAGGTLQIDYRPDVGFQQNVTTTLFIKTRWAAATTGFGDLSAQDMGSNYGLTAPAFTNRRLALSRNVGFGIGSIKSYYGTNTKSVLAGKYITALGAGSGSIYIYADYNGYDRTGSRVYTYTVTKNVTGGNAISDLDEHSTSITNVTNFSPYITFYSSTGSGVSMYLRATGDRSDSNNVYWKIAIITTS